MPSESQDVEMGYSRVLGAARIFGQEVNKDTDNRRDSSVEMHHMTNVAVVLVPDRLRGAGYRFAALQTMFP